MLQKSKKWAETQSAWQQDAITRIYGQGELLAQEFEVLFTLLKTEHGIADPVGRKPSLCTRLNAKEVELFSHSGTSSGYLYSDSPWSSRAAAQMYLKRLQLLRANLK